jgi:hypothetical protein
MVAKLFVGVFILTLAPVIVAAQNAVLLSSDDIYLTTRLTKGTSGAPASGAMISIPTRLCGFQIRGNHRSRTIPRTEWDINIDEIDSGTDRIAGITAGAFDVVSGHERKARPPIVDLSFSIEGNPQTIAARIVGAPNADNGIKAVLETESAKQLFSAFSDDAHILTIALKYADSSSDALQIRGYRDLRKFGGGKNSMFNECLRGHIPERGIQEPIP